MSISLTAQELQTLPPLNIDVGVANVLRTFIEKHKNDIPLDDMGTIGKFYSTCSAYVSNCIKQIQQQREQKGQTQKLPAVVEEVATEEKKEE